MAGSVIRVCIIREFFYDSNNNNNNDEYDNFLSVKTILFTTRCGDRVYEIDPNPVKLFFIIYHPIA